MKYFLLILLIFIGGLLFTNSAIPADQPSPKSKNRWGITTNESDEDNTDKQQPPNKVANDAETKNQPISKPQQPPVQEVKSSAQKGDKSVSSADSKEPKTHETSKTYEYPDRPWIIKKEHMKQAPALGEKPRAVKWKTEKQQIRCEANLKQIRENFLKARYYSMKGDFCHTANYANTFLNLVEDCKQECPEKLLEHYGYTKRIIRNLNWLEELGTKQCLGKNKTTKTGKN